MTHYEASSTHKLLPQKQIKRRLVYNLPVADKECSSCIQFPVVSQWFPVSPSRRHVLLNRVSRICQNRIRKTAGSAALIRRTKRCKGEIGNSWRKLKENWSPEYEGFVENGV